MQGSIIIIGAGQAGAQLALSLREEGHVGPITLLGAEPWLPYQRPPLSKAYLEGAMGSDQLTLRGPAAFAAADITLMLGQRAEAIDRTSRQVRLVDGRVLAADHLVMATGSRPRMLPGCASWSNMHVLRDLDDADALSAGLRAHPGGRLAIIGGGFIGLEVAAVARMKFGLEVDVIERDAQVLGRAVSPPTAGVIARHLREAGVRIHAGAAISHFDTDGDRLMGLILQSGDRIGVDLVLLGIGGIACDDLAGTGQGIEVDGWLTLSPGIHAIGDCARFPDGHGGRHRIESVQNAVDQARWLARYLTGRTHEPFEALNWFWSNIGGLKLQIAGLRQPDDELVHMVDDIPERAISCLFRDGRLAAVETVNRPADHMMARRLLVSGAVPSIEEVRAVGCNLRALQGQSQPT